MNSAYQLDFFQSRDFSLKRFIDELVQKTPSAQLEGASDRDDLLPFITAFEGQLKELHALKDEIAGKVQSLSTEIELAEGELQEACQAMASCYLEVAGAVRGLEAGCERLGHEPLDTGRRLNRLHTQKQRAEHVSRVLGHLQVFQQSPNNAELLDMITSSEDRAQEGAAILGTLLGIAKTLCPGEARPSPGGSATALLAAGAAGNIKEFAEAINRRSSSEFKECLLVDDVDKLRRIYNTQRIIGGGGECREFFVGEHPLVKGVKVAQTSIKSAYYHDKTRAPAVIRCGQEEAIEPQVKELMDRVTTMLRDECEELEEIFGDDTLLVLGRLAKDIMAGQMKVVVVECLRQAKQHSLLAHQRALHAIYSQFTRFCIELDTVCDGLSDLVADSVDAILQPYLGSLHSDERSCLDELLRLLQQPIAVQLAKRRADTKKSMIFVPPTGSTAQLQPGAAGLERAVLFMFGDGRPLISGEEGCDGLLTIDIVQRGLVLVGEAGARIVTMVDPPTADHLLVSLLTLCLQHHYLAAINDMADMIVVADHPPKYGFDQSHAKFMQSCHSTLNVVQLWFEHHYGLLASSASPNCYSECVRIKNEWMKTVESKVSLVGTRSIDWIVDFFREIYYKQQHRSDFNPKDEADYQTIMARQQSPVCDQIVLFLRRTAGSIAACVEEAIAGPWLYRLGCRVLHSLLHDHLRRFSVSETGAVAFLKDCVHYAQCIPRDLFGSGGVAHAAFPWEAQLAAHCGALRELGRLHVVKIEGLRAALQESALASVDPRLLEPFLMCRSDIRANPRLLESILK